MKKRMIGLVFLFFLMGVYASSAIQVGSIAEFKGIDLSSYTNEQLGQQVAILTDDGLQQMTLGELLASMEAESADEIIIVDS